MHKQTQQDDQEVVSEAFVQKLMVFGFVCPENGCALTSEVRRGMPIFSTEGRQVGKVAAVVINSANHTATHLLLCRLPEVNGYWLVPVSWIARVKAEEVHLKATDPEIQSLPQWHEA